MIICWSVLLRQQWVEHERFSFPLLQLQWICSNPRKRADQPFLQKLCNVDWVKSIPVVLHGLNRVTSLLSIHSESTCFLPIFQDTSPRSLFRIDIVAPVQLFIYPSVIAVVYLLKLEISFSFWFFFLLTKIESILNLRC